MPIRNKIAGNYVSVQMRRQRYQARRSDFQHPVTSVVTPQMA